MQKIGLRALVNQDDASGELLEQGSVQQALQILESHLGKQRQCPQLLEFMGAQRLGSGSRLLAFL